MPIPQRSRFPSSDPRLRLLLTDDGSLTLEEIATGDTYHSGCGAVAECDHVYLRNSGIHEQLTAGRAAKVLEVGFGSGLAFLRTALVASQAGSPLHYVAIEQRPLAAELLRETLIGPHLRRSLDDAERTIAEHLVAAWEQAVQPTAAGSLPPQFVWRSGRDGAALELCVHLQPLSRCQDWLPDHSFDAIYFDPFCPANNADLWTEEVFARMHDCLAPTGKLVSYCVSSRVRAALVRCGFEVDRLAGPPGGKREVLIAKRAESGAAREEPAAPADGR